MFISKQIKTYFFIRRKRIIFVLLDCLIYFFIVFLLSIGSNHDIQLTNIFMRYMPIWLLINYLSNRYHTYVFKNIKNFFVEISKLIINNLLFFSIICITIYHKDINLINYTIGQFISIFILTIILQLIVKTIIFYRKKENKILIISEYNKYLEIFSEIKSVNNLKIDSLGYEAITDFNDIKSKYKVLVIENLSLLSEEQMKKLFKLKEKGLLILDVFQFYDTFLQRYPPIIFRKEILINKSFQNSGYLRFKRFGDLMFSILILLIFLPFGLITSLLILFEDGWPIFYKQLRTGQNGSEFQVFKFRTMKNNSEKDGPQWAKRNDERITKFGKILRLTRIDEIPQLLCVIKGQMSLIGPRPERPEIELLLEKEISSYRIRHTIKPGLSGWAQINYPYGASIEDSKNKLSYDLYYINKVSFLLDLIIFFRTMKLIVNAMNAIPKK